MTPRLVKTPDGWRELPDRLNEDAIAQKSWEREKAERAALDALLARVETLEVELDQLATCSNMLLEGWRDEDSPERMFTGHILEGIEFSVMRSAWLLGEPDEARRLHGIIGDHSPDGCPVCVGDKAFARAALAPSAAEPTEPSA